MQRNIYMNLMITMKKKANRNYLLLMSVLFFTGCSLSPGMHMDTSKSNNQEYVYIESIDSKVEVKNISLKEKDISQSLYRIGNGDQIAITVWGLPEVFPISNINPDQNLRRVDSNGNIYFPYVGLINASGKTQNALRDAITTGLANFFTEPQVDVSIARFNSQKIYLLGEVTRPKKLNITDIPISLADALGEVNGLNTSTASGGQVFIIRQEGINGKPIIYRANLDSPSGFLDAGSFYMQNNDIVYVNAKNTTRWNRVISQFFPFSTFLNSVDNLVSD